jgi:heavy metal sensor kinase
MRPLSSRLKIALLSAAISGLVLVFFASLMHAKISKLRLEGVDREIRSLATRHPGLFAGRGAYERLASSLEFTFGAAFTNRVMLSLQDEGGRVLHRTPNWPETLPAKLTEGLRLAPAAAADPELDEAASDRGFRARRGFGAGAGGPPPMVFDQAPVFQTASIGGVSWRFGAFRSEGATLLLALSQGEVDAELDRIALLFWLTLPGALLCVAAGGWMVAGRALQPLAAIAHSAQQVTARGLDQRIPPATASPEAARLIEVLNRMMDRLEASFRQATRFSADASHELKTPLAVMQGEIEIALQAAGPGSAQQHLLSGLLDEIQRLKHITRSLLLLAQADAGQLKLALEPVDLTAQLHDVLEDARVLAEPHDLSIEASLQPGLVVQADRPLLHHAVFNLVTNSIKHNHKGGAVSLTLAAAAQQACLTVSNTGPGIPAEAHARVFERFARFRNAEGPPVEGAGLGLSLAREIARAHGGDLVLVESAAGRTCFRLLLPLP